MIYKNVDVLLNFFEYIINKIYHTIIHRRIIDEFEHVYVYKTTNFGASLTCMIIPILTSPNEWYDSPLVIPGMSNIA